MLKKIKPYFFAIIILIIAIFIFIYFVKTKPIQPTVEIKPKVWQVQVLSVVKQIHTPIITLFGQVESQNISASAPVSGVIGKVLVKEGSSFKKGDLLVALSDTDIEIPYQTNQANLKEIQAQIELEKSSFSGNKTLLEYHKHLLNLKQKSINRIGSLISRNLSSQTNLDNAKEALVRQEMATATASLLVKQHSSRLAQLNAQLQKASLSLQSSKISLNRGKVIAPFAGRVLKLNVQEGDQVSPNSPLLSFYSLSNLEVRANIPYSKISQIYKSINPNESKTSQALNANFVDTNNTGKTYNLPLLRLAGLATASGINAFFAIPSDLKTPRSGSILNLTLPTIELENTVAVPFSALYGINKIYLVVDNHLQSQIITNLGETKIDGEDFVIISSDSKNFIDGAKILTTQLPNAITGLNVSIQNQIR